MNALMNDGKIAKNSRVALVNDGSGDRTWEIIERLHGEDPLFSGINLSRNRGHQNALLAGMMTVMDRADMVISMDADLQDDIEAVDEMLKKYYEGCDIVYGVRNDRSTDTAFKRGTARGYYRMMKMMGADIVPDHADFRLMSRRSVKALLNYSEVNLFLRGIVPALGFRTDVVYYERGERFAGESKYPLRKMIAFALQGITSMSTTPIQCITFLGIFIFVISIIMLIYSFIRHMIGATIVGWTTLMISVWAIGGLILLSLGVIGEYIGKIYMETKHRPRFIIEEFLDREHGYVFGDDDNDEADR
jgi:glycosyltransferase involved in cell wall biosynthesis